MKKGSIIKVVNRGTGKCIEVGVDGVTEIVSVGALHLAYVGSGGERRDTCTIDPSYAIVTRKQ
jgi:hypothetical protein